MPEPLSRRLFAETLGTAFLLATVIGSGIMGERLAGGNVALALLGNTLPTGAILVVLILIFGPVSGAHFNPAVSLAFALRGELAWVELAPYIAAQVVGGILGVFAAHAMFELPILQISAHVRTGPAQWFAEAVASFGLALAIFGCVARAPQAVPHRPAFRPSSLPSLWACWPRSLSQGDYGRPPRADRASASRIALSACPCLRSRPFSHDPENWVPVFGQDRAKQQ
jgi:glycerol uptake facilitator-like aquaporin